MEIKDFIKDLDTFFFYMQDANVHFFPPFAFFSQDPSFATFFESKETVLFITQSVLIKISLMKLLLRKHRQDFNILSERGDKEAVLTVVSDSISVCVPNYALRFSLFAFLSSGLYCQLGSIHSSKKRTGQASYNTIHQDSSKNMEYTYLHENRISWMQKRYSTRVA